MTLTGGNTPCPLPTEQRLALLEAAHGRLLSAVRAAVAASWRDEPDPVAHLRYLLAETGQLPPQGARPEHLLAGTFEAPSAAVYQRTFSGHPETITQVRKFVAGVLTECPRAYDAQLCASELATNALMHTASGQVGGQFTVRIQVRGQVCVRVEVADQGAHPRSVTAHGTHPPAHEPSVTAQGSARMPHVPEQCADLATARPEQRNAALERPAGEGGLGLAVVRALVGDQGGDEGLSWRRTPEGNVVSCQLTWSALTHEAAER